MPIWKWRQFGNFVPYLFVQALDYICQGPRTARAYTPQIQKRSALIACLAQRIRVHVEVRNGHDRARGVWAAPQRRRSNEAIWPRIPVPRIAYSGRDKENSWPNPWHKEWRLPIYVWVSFHNVEGPVILLSLHCCGWRWYFYFKWRIWR